jgi:hypothetical protein
MRASFVLLALALAACTDRADPRDAAVDTCVAAVKTAGQLADPTAAGRNVAMGCAGLYRESACRDGFARAWDPSTGPAERTRIMVDACTAAYCGKLDAPKPELCTQPASDFAERAAQWRAFQKSVLTRDLGAERTARVLEAMRAAADLRASDAH